MNLRNKFLTIEKLCSIFRNKISNNQSVYVKKSRVVLGRLEETFGRGKRSSTLLGCGKKNCQAKLFHNLKAIVSTVHLSVLDPLSNPNGAVSASSFPLFHD